MCEIKKNALKAIARKCSKEMTGHSKDIFKLISIKQKYEPDVILLGFNWTQLKYEIGLLNNRLTER